MNDSDRLNINNEMRQLDAKNRQFYDELTDEERKKFSNYLMIRWSSAVSASTEMQEYYVQSCNHYLNRHFFAVNRHPKLQWLMATAVSPGLGNQRHTWISPKKKDDNAANAGTKKKQLMTLFPALKGSDAETWSKLITQRDLDAYRRDLGDQ